MASSSGVYLGPLSSSAHCCIVLVAVCFPEVLCYSWLAPSSKFLVSCFGFVFLYLVFLSFWCYSKKAAPFSSSLSIWFLQLVSQPLPATQTVMTKTVYLSASVSSNCGIGCHLWILVGTSYYTCPMILLYVQHQVDGTMEQNINKYLRSILVSFILSRYSILSNICFSISDSVTTLTVIATVITLFIVVALSLAVKQFCKKTRPTTVDEGKWNT